jgi:hypothetical protein
MECDGRIAATTLQYTGPDVVGAVTVMVAGENFRNDPVNYNFPGGLTNGTVLTSGSENNWTVDASSHGESTLGTRMSIYINGVEEEHHTFSTAPYVVGLPAPLNDPKGDPSPLWLVVSFTQ